MSFSTYKKGIEQIEMHENSSAHREAEKSYLMTKFCISQDSTVVAEFIKAERKQVERNRRIFHRLADTTLFLA